MKPISLKQLALVSMIALVSIFWIAGCVGAPPSAPDEAAGLPDGEREQSEDTHLDEQALPAMVAVELEDGQRLQVVASTNIIADVVAQVGGDQIDLVGLIPVGADPHSFEPRPQDLVALNEAHVIFVNGLGLEEPLEPLLENLDGDGVVVSVNTGVETRQLGDEETDHAHEEGDHADEGEHTDEAEHAEEETHAEAGDHADAEHAHAHGDIDPHTWFSIDAVTKWVDNVETALSALDPANAATYADNAAAYRAELAALDAELADQLAVLPVEQRKLVTDHDSLGYLADAYDFEVVGTVIPSLSTLAAPSAAQLALLQEQIREEDAKAVFVGTTVNPNLAEQLAADTGIAVVPIYTGSLSDPDGPAGSYVEFMRYAVAAIVEALGGE